MKGLLFECMEGKSLEKTVLGDNAVAALTVEILSNIKNAYKRVLACKVA